MEVTEESNMVDSATAVLAKAAYRPRTRVTAPRDGEWGVSPWPPVLTVTLRVREGRTEGGWGARLMRGRSLGRTARTYWTFSNGDG